MKYCSQRNISPHFLAAAQQISIIRLSIRSFSKFLLT